MSHDATGRSNEPKRHTTEGNTLEGPTKKNESSDETYQLLITLIKQNQDLKDSLIKENRDLKERLDRSENNVMSNLISIVHDCYFKVNK